MLVSRTKQERVRDNQRRSRARRQEYTTDLERRFRDNQTRCRDADLQKSAFLDLQKENSSLRYLLMMAGVSSDLIDTFVHQSNGRQSSEPSFSGRQLKPKLHVLSSSSSGSSPAWSDASEATHVQSSSISSIEPWNSTISRAGTHSLHSESELCNAEAALWSHANDEFTVAAQGELNQFFDSLGSYDHLTAQERTLLHCNTTLDFGKPPVFESMGVPCSTQWLRT